MEIENLGNIMLALLKEMCKKDELLNKQVDDLTIAYEKSGKELHSAEHFRELDMLVGECKRRRGYENV